MSLLQRLSERAQALKSEQVDGDSSKEERRLRFTQQTIPALKELESFLRALNQTLRTVKPTVRMNFEVAGYGTFEATPTFDWQFVPGEPRTTEFNLELRFKSRVNTEASTKLTLNSVDRIRAITESFRRLHLGGVREEKRGPTGLITNATVQAAGFVNSRVRIRANIEEDVVHFHFENIDTLAEVRRQIGSEFLGAEVNNRLGEFILRENDLFIREAWIRSLVPTQNKIIVEAAPTKPESPFKAFADLDPPAPAVVATPVKAPEVVPEPVSLESAEDRELDFLAELKFAARYADSAVKKNIESDGDNGFGQERDLASLRSAFQKQNMPKVEKQTAFAAESPDSPSAEEFLKRMQSAKVDLGKS